VNEFELIDRLCRDLPVNASTTVGAGDDCAVLDLGVPGRCVLFKTDAVVEGVHFEAGTEPERVGRKALARCLSDVAAMAGMPTHALVTVGLPDATHAEWIQAAYRGLTRLARDYDVAVVGGETTTVPVRMLSVSLLGWVERGRSVLRSGACPGDALFVTGELGGSLGSGRHLDFEPRLKEARWLAAEFEVHAMLDLSDGLAGDLGQLVRASGAGAELMAESIPVSRAARLAAKAGGRPALAAALGDGEDFELLFAVPARQAVPLRDAWHARFPGLRLSCIGKVRQEAGVVLRDRTGVRPMEVHGYVHFQKP
jgi:thiamine-monophosphate kinase